MAPVGGKYGPFNEELTLVKIIYNEVLTINSHELEVMTFSEPHKFENVQH